MKPRIDPDRADRLYAEALDIQEGRKLGLWLPRMRHLALRDHGYAMVELARFHAEQGSDRDPLARRLYLRAFRQGHTQAAQHLAMGSFNRGDMKGYRYWLAQGAKAGDEDAQRERRFFETRLPHLDARKVGRLRPWHKRD